MLTGPSCVQRRGHLRRARERAHARRTRWKALPPDTPADRPPAAAPVPREEIRAAAREIRDARLELEEPTAEPAATGPSLDLVSDRCFPTLHTLRRWPAEARIVATGLWFAYSLGPANHVCFSSTPATSRTSLGLAARGCEGVAGLGADRDFAGRQEYVAFISGNPIDPARARRVVGATVVDSLTAKPVDGTVGAFLPFWKPDSSRIGFFHPVTHKLKSIPVGGGRADVIADTASPPRRNLERRRM